MALAGRSRRGGGGRRWLVVGIVLTLVVVLADASIKSRSTAPLRRLSAQAWLDRAYSIIGSEGVAADDLSGFLGSRTSKVTTASVTAQLDSMHSATESAAKAFAKLVPPVELVNASGLLDAALITRAQAAGAIATSVGRELSGPPGQSAANATATAVAAAITKLQIADQTYKLFAAAIPSSLDTPPPISQWITTSTGQSSAELAVFLAGLRSSVSTAPVHQIDIEAVTTDPSALTERNGVQILTPSAGLTVTVVVGNTGNQGETDLTVAASVNPASSNGTASHDQVIATLSPGTSQTVTVGTLNPAQAKPVELTVTVTPANGAATAAQTRTIAIEMPAPTSSTSTTTSTVPGKSTTTTTSVPSSSTTTGPTGTSGATTTTTTTTTPTT